MIGENYGTSNYIQKLSGKKDRRIRRTETRKSSSGGQDDAQHLIPALSNSPSSGGEKYGRLRDYMQTSPEDR